MSRRYACPIEGCEYRGHTRDALFGHLYEKHLKAELITWILARANPVEAWKERSGVRDQETVG